MAEATESTPTEVVGEVEEAPQVCTECAEAKKVADECVLANGKENCVDVLEAYKKCMKDMGFEI